MQNYKLLTFIRSIFLIQVFIIVLIIGVSVEINQYNSRLQMEKFSLPFSRIKIDNKIASAFFKEVNVVMGGVEDKGIISSAYFRKDMPENLLASNIQALALTEYKNVQLKEEKQDNIQLPSIVQEKTVNRETDYYSLFNNYCVVFYCTHSAETYIPDSGKAKCEGERGLVNNVALSIAGNLKERGLSAEFVNTIHDYPEYNKSYTNSRKTVKKTIETQDNLLALFDVHRDSIPESEEETLKVKGKRSARILIIVGTDQRKSHPQWHKNLKFAEQIFIKGEKMYPGLIKGVRTKAGTYNQELHTHSLLLEVGNDSNSLEEARYAGELFSDILIEVLKEELL